MTPPPTPTAGDAQALFRQIETWVPENVDAALAAITANAALKRACLDRYQRILALVGAKTLVGLKTLPTKLQTRPCLMTPWTPGPVDKEILATIPIESFQLNNVGLTALPEWVCALRRLRHLDLSNSTNWRAKNLNQVSSLPACLGDLTALEVLNLSRIKLRTLPDSIGGLTSLRVFEAMHNELEVLPSTITALPKLEVLDLFINRLSTLPDLGGIKTLRALMLAANRLEVVPPWIGALTELTTLTLAANPISELPAFLGELRALTVLDIYRLEKRPTGPLPDGYANLTALRQFRFDGSKVRPFPAFVATFEHLASIRSEHTGEVSRGRSAVQEAVQLAIESSGTKRRR